MMKKIGLFFLLVLAGCSQNVYMKGEKLANQGEYDRAIDAFYKDIAVDPKNAEAWRELGIAFYKKGEMAKAEDAFKQANQIKPDPLANFYIGLIYEKDGAYDKAIDAYTASLNLNPKGKARSTIRERLDQLIALKLKSDAAAAVKNESEIDAHSIPENSIAVVNFDGSKLPPEMAPIGTGLAEFTSADLSKVTSLKVVDRMKIDAIVNELKLSSSGYVDPSTAPRAGRLMGSRKLITGTILPVGDNKIRVDGAVVNTADKSTAEAAPAEGDVKEFFKIQKGFVFDIIDRIGITLTPEERDAIQKVPTESYLALMAYCRGLDFSNRGMYKEARKEFQMAASADRGFSEARAALTAVPSLAPPGQPGSTGQLEAKVVTEIKGTLTSVNLDQRLAGIVLDGGLIPNLDFQRPDLIQPLIDNYGQVIITGGIDAK